MVTLSAIMRHCTAFVHLKLDKYTFSLINNRVIARTREKTNRQILMR